MHFIMKRVKHGIDLMAFTINTAKWKVSYQNILSDHLLQLKSLV